MATIISKRQAIRSTLQEVQGKLPGIGLTAQKGISKVVNHNRYGSPIKKFLSSQVKERETLMDAYQDPTMVRKLQDLRDNFLRGR
ncbi:hypothetical protein [Ewingella americana]|uniref:Uncharacterized protein n=1 Tax=Ewingella americana TaxID=41202 RepID=A0A502GG60_9GAMM|nr:hypothetical protein [Ewingella americana]TPG59986.1 hypothetical protein EAH77_15580 [Ewingella americana]